MVMAADEPPPCAAIRFDSALAFWMEVVRASLIAFASDLAFLDEIKLNVYGTGYVWPFACANIFSITFGLVSGSCWRLVIVSAIMANAGGAFGGAAGVHETAFLSFERARMPSCFL